MDQDMRRKWLIIIFLCMTTTSNALIGTEASSALTEEATSRMQTPKTYFKEKDGALIIGNDLLEIWIDRTTGGVANLVNKITQHKHLSGERSCLFRISFDSKVPSIWNATSSDLVFATSDQQVSEYWVEEIPRKKRLRVKYDQLHAQGKPYNISITYSITVSQDQSLTLWDLEMENREKGVVTELDFPRFEGLLTLGGTGSDCCLLVPNCAGEKIRDPIERLGSNQNIRLMYPAPASMQWMEFGNSHHGLYLASLDQSISYTELAFGKTDTIPFIQISKFPFTAQDQAWNSHPYAVGIHTGDWHWSADQYREWLETWCQKMHTPKWVKELPGIHWTWVVRQEDNMVRRFSDLPKLFDQLESALGNPPALYIHGWWKGGFDTNLPEFVTSDLAGGEEELKKAIEYIHSRGGRVIPYFNGRITDVQTETYGSHGQEWAVIAEDGHERREQYGTPPRSFIVNCPSVTSWRDTLLGFTLNAIRDYDIDGIYYDQIGCAWACLCYNPNHSHTTPATAWAGYLDFLEAHGQAQNTLKQDMFYSTEELCDVFTQYFNWGIDWMGHWQNGRFAFQALFTGALGEYFPELTRYTMPWHITSGPWQLPNVDFNMLAWNFILGKRFNYDDPAPIRPYAMMYDVAKDAFYHGRFMDTVGLSFEQPSDSQIVGKVHVGENSIAVPLWNKGKKTNSIKVKLNLTELGSTQSVGKVVDLGVELGFRQGCVRLPFTLKNNVLEFEVFNLGSQEATAVHVLPDKPVGGQLTIKNMNFSSANVSKGERLTIDVAVVSPSGSSIRGANVTVFVDELTVTAEEADEGIYRATINTEELDVGGIRVTAVAEKQGYHSDLREMSFRLKTQPTILPYFSLFAIAPVVLVVLFILHKRSRARNQIERK